MVSMGENSKSYLCMSLLSEADVLAQHCNYNGVAYRRKCRNQSAIRHSLGSSAGEGGHPWEVICFSSKQVSIILVLYGLSTRLDLTGLNTSQLDHGQKSKTA
ncbi:hypothetical protein AVEN_63018-1 [Araneus ventricosus]|uniref:Uncharacterized protein n=1 Tax=Araneus ventricosus TaxID=182803 RepID=A0A4Y2CQY9_ARAVE|nr:hypothetical protein AVEN_63018-1 [Araneus ventricosus]